MTPTWAGVGHYRPFTRDEPPSDITTCVANCIGNALSTAGCQSTDPMSICSCGAGTAMLAAWECISGGCTLNDYESFSDVLAECGSEGYTLPAGVDDPPTTSATTYHSESTATRAALPGTSSSRSRSTIFPSSTSETESDSAVATDASAILSASRLARPAAHESSSTRRVSSESLKVSQASPPTFSSIEPSTFPLSFETSSSTAGTISMGRTPMTSVYGPSSSTTSVDHHSAPPVILLSVALGVLACLMVAGPLVWFLRGRGRTLRNAKRTTDVSFRRPQNALRSDLPPPTCATMGGDDRQSSINDANLPGEHNQKELETNMHNTSTSSYHTDAVPMHGQMSSGTFDPTAPIGTQSVVHPSDSTGDPLLADIPTYDEPARNGIGNETPLNDARGEMCFPASQTRLPVASSCEIGREAETLAESVTGPSLRQMQPLSAAIGRPISGTSLFREQGGHRAMGTGQINSAISLQRSLPVPPRFQVVEVLMEVEDAEDPEEPPPYSPRLQTNNLS